jgi:hypothetical protein
LVLDLAGICAGNLVWLVGLALWGVGLWLIRVAPESIYKMIGYLSLSTTDPTQGLPGLLRGLLEPKPRTRTYGLLVLLFGLILMAGGALLIKLCA